MRHEESLSWSQPNAQPLHALIQQRMDTAFEGVSAAMAAPMLLSWAPFEFRLWGLITTQACLEITGLALIRLSKLRHEDSGPIGERPLWSLGAFLYAVSLVVYAAALSNAALSWLVVASCSMNILLSAACSFALGERLRWADICAITCSLTSALLMAFVIPDVNPDMMMDFGNKLQEMDKRSIIIVAALLLVQIFLIGVLNLSSLPVAAPAAVLCYSIASGSAQMFTKLFSAFGPECGVVPFTPGGKMGECPLGPRGPTGFLILCIFCGGVSTFLMLRGVYWFETKLWLPNALAVDLVVTSLIGLVVCGEARQLEEAQFLGFVICIILSALSLRLSVHGQEMESHPSQPLQPTAAVESKQGQ
mmetsp:Transcript_39040/g.71085  ORF Transcript_39040/g.71085 Transcript_39040/m.71085 type:complete len:362 (-) Transcript_39040:70-1155(-)